MIDATFKAALDFFTEDIERARDILVAEVESLASGSADEIEDLVDEILEDAEQSAKDGFIVVERKAIKALNDASYDGSGDLKAVLRNFGWEFDKALRELKQTLVNSEATS